MVLAREIWYATYLPDEVPGTVVIYFAYADTRGIGYLRKTTQDHLPLLTCLATYQYDTNWVTTRRYTLNQAVHTKYQVLVLTDCTYIHTPVVYSSTRYRFAPNGQKIL